jgi:DNA-binding NarL/FixJ family response regulator
MSIRFCIVEDDELIREGFTQVLSNADGLEFIASYSSAEAFMKDIRTSRPDVVLMDIQLPGRSGIECVLEMKSKYPAIQFLICSVFDDNDNIYDALCAGATGYLLKSCNADQLVNSIFEIHRGESPMSGTIARKVIANFHGSKKANEYLELLSEREREILELLSRGFRYKEIADKLSLSVETIRTHIRNIYLKLQVSSRTDAINKVFPK